MACIEARGLRKAYGTTIALDGVDLRVEAGRILGLIGPNGAGKTTALDAILGLIPFEGELKVLGRDPWTERDQLMRDVCLIADVAVLPRWMRVSQALDYVAGVHPRFDRAKAEGFLAKTTIKRGSKVRQLSKGMVAQLHLALVMAIDAKLLVLDEPTLGLDILYRKQFYDSLLNVYLQLRERISRAKTRRRKGGRQFRKSLRLGAFACDLRLDIKTLEVSSGRRFAMRLMPCKNFSGKDAKAQRGTAIQEIFAPWRLCVRPPARHQNAGGSSGIPFAMRLMPCKNFSGKDAKAQRGTAIQKTFAP